MTNQNIAFRQLVGRNLAKARRELKYTQREIALKLFGNEKDHLKISKAETGVALPDCEVLHHLCRLYGVSSDWVLGFTDVVELSPVIGNAGVLFTSLINTLDEELKKLCFELCMQGSKHISNFPSPLYLELLNKIDVFLNIVAEIPEAKTKEFYELKRISKQCRNVLKKQEQEMQEQVETLLSTDKSFYDADNLLLSLEPDTNSGKFNKALALSAVKKNRGA